MWNEVVKQVKQVKEVKQVILKRGESPFTHFTLVTPFTLFTCY